MKKTLLSVVLVLAMMLSLCGSALAIEQSDIEGVWDVDLAPVFVAQGVPEDQVDALIELMGMTMTMTFTPDQQCIMETVAAGEVSQEVYTYVLEGDKIIMNDGSQSELVRGEETLTIIDPDGYTMVLAWHGPVGEVVIQPKANVVIDSEIVGVWELDINAVLTMTGTDLSTMSEEEAAMVKGMAAMMSITMEFTADGRLIMSMTMMGETQVEESTYELQGNQIIMDGMPSDFVIEGNTLTITEEGQSLTMTRVEAVEEPAA